MNALLELLRRRNSAARLVEPAPAPGELEQIFRAAVRAPDHGQLHPWRFIVIEGEGRQALGELFVSVQEQQGADFPEEKRQKLRNNPLRAPMIIVVVAKPVVHPKVPVAEQQLSAACAAHAILLAAEACGYAGIWRTGDMAYHPEVARRLGLQGSENIIGFLYLGTRQGEPKPLQPVEMAALVSHWPPL